MHRPDPLQGELVGESRATEEVREVIDLVAARRVTVLITGETGTGKEVVARAIHQGSNRANQPLVAVNCTALPAQLAESELFGHVRGAFTGAERTRAGRFEQANRGTLFLDEVGDLPMDLQGKLLRVLQEQSFERVGSSETIQVDVRVIAATNINLEQAVRERRFREDLYYRLNVVPIRLRPLRERPEDIPALVQHLLRKISSVEYCEPKRVSPDALTGLMRQPWPGNVRQLEHALQMAFVLSGDRRELVLRDFASLMQVQNAAPYAEVTLGPDGIDFEETVTALERRLVEQALQRSGGNKAKAAELLRIKRTTLLAKMKSIAERELHPVGGSHLVDNHVDRHCATASLVM